MLLKEEKIGVDLEADSMYCFKEKICLLQISSAKNVFLIDPFELKDISPFLKVLENKDVSKVFHGADFDIRSLDRDYKARVNNLFDTEIAARFLGFIKRSLADLLKKNFNIAVNKKFQKENWAKRPLAQEMIEYSVKDAAYLVPLYEIIKNQLIEKKRFLWAKEEFKAQEQVRYKNYNILPLYKRFKGAGKIDKRTLAVLENLLQLRMKIAQKKDKPLFKIMSNQSLMTKAVKKPVTINKVLQIKAVSKRQADMYSKLSVDAIAKAMNQDDKELPLYSKPDIREKTTAKAKANIKRLKKIREKKSCSMGIEPGFLQNNTLISSIAYKEPAAIEDLLKINSIRQWQVKAMGNDILSSLRGTDDKEGEEKI